MDEKRDAALDHEIPSREPWLKGSTTRLILILSALALGTQNYIQSQSLKAEIVRNRTVEAQTLNTDWTSGGVKYTVITPRNTDEGTAAWWDRHDAAVAEGIRRHPKD